ncbi:glycosyl hydrolase family 65 protein [Streptomyces sp. NRRL S-495]|uniref:glycosyl hydrolase family 65 protein n=1 Tax=Streptomyces sp. NRRL S-495 TaxID=1609133 RepID=UPI0005F9444F|nr:glycosyl hydrolase family 65 protein [Streptomyces sp. NRRL S-495]KJY26975.1 hypothetical protein VR45_35900 [Streptomyces sp. NRRL S-495]
MLTRADRRASWRYFRDALVADLRDSQHGTTAEGIHLGAMAGAVDLLQRCYTGLEVREDGLRLDPHLPSALGRLELELCYRGHRGVVITVDRRAVTVALGADGHGTVRIHCRGTTAVVGPGETRILPL